MISISLVPWMNGAPRVTRANPPWTARRARSRCGLQLEALEDRRLLSTIVDLGTLGGIYAQAYGINNLGQATGTSLAANDQDYAYFYDGTTMTSLGAFRKRGFTAGLAINDAGQVAGFGDLRHNVPNNHAFLWDGAHGLQDLGTLGGRDSEAYAINSFGEVVGESSLPRGAGIDAFLYSNGTMQDLSTLGGAYSRATGINDADQVVGFSNLAGSYTQHAFLWDGVNGMQDLGTLGGNQSVASAINASGQVTGFSDVASGSTDAFLWDNANGMQDLGTLPGYLASYGRAINASGQVVGESLFEDSHQIYYHAFLYNQGTMTDLNDLLPPNSGWTLNYAYGINDAGQITGVGTYAGSGERAYVLTLDAIVPEASTGLAGRSNGITSDPVLLAEFSLPIQSESGTSLENRALTSPESSSVGLNDPVFPLSDSASRGAALAVSPQRTRPQASPAPDMLTSLDAAWPANSPTPSMGDDVWATLGYFRA